jgi:hypothetical protein
MILAAHQPNFIPWFSFFEKIAKADIFVILKEVQFEKNGWQNRCQVFGKYWTNPVINGLQPIKDKVYVNKQKLLEVNMHWIYAIASTLGVEIRKIKFDFATEKKGTERLIELCKFYKADKYLTNPEAIDKYLDAKLMKENGIKIIPFVTKNKKHVFELFNEIGIEATAKLLKQ